MSSTTLVSLFYNINRDRWTGASSKDNRKDYLVPFREFMKLKYRMIVYIDETFYNDVTEDLKNFPEANIELIPINEQWMKDNIWAWSKLDREREIMNDSNYQNRLHRRISLGYPENTKPEYTIITHSKIDTINYAIETDKNPTDYYMWVDFGYFQNKISEKFIPNEGVVNLDVLNKDTVNICCVNKIDERDRDIDYTLINAPEKIGAYCFFGNKEKLKEFQILCHKWLEHFQSIGIADDEQHLWLQCYFENPELFTEHVFGQWHLGLKKFSK